MSQLRRRTFGGISADELLLYPDYFFYDVLTTSDNQDINIGAYTYASRLVDVICDGESIKSSAHNNNPSYITIPTAGYHKIYIKFQNCDAGHFPRIDAYSFIRFPKDTPDFDKNTRCNMETNGVLVNIDPNGFGCHSNSGSETRAHHMATKIIIPVGTTNVYKTISPYTFSNIYSKFVEKDVSNRVLNNLDKDNISNL